MGKHSRQANTREYFTSGERAKAKKEYGTQVSRLGAESQRKFDMCNLCMDRLAKDCVATPSGFLYCRECILKHLVASKEAIDAHRAAYEEQQKRLAAEAAASAATAHASVVVAFERRESAMTVAGGGRAGSAATAAAGGAAPSAAAAAAAGVGATALAVAARKAEDEKARIAAAVVALKSHADHRDHAEKLAEARAASFWVPDSTPSAAEGLLPPPDPCPRDPQSGEFLRAKQLVPLKLARADPPKTDDDDAGVASSSSSSSSSSAVGGADAGAAAAAAGEPDDADATSAASGISRFMCPTCLRGIVYQQTYLFKS